jgi:cell wall-associated NlpC family hydrolase
VNRALGKKGARQLASVGQGIPVVNDSGGKIPAKTQAILSEAHKYLGVKYVWGGATPQGFDCSGFLKYLYAKAGINLPHYTIGQWAMGKKVDRQNLQPGDAVFFHWGSHPSTGETGPQHMGIYIGNGKFMHAPSTGDVVKISSLSERDDFLGGRRFL